VVRQVDKDGKVVDPAIGQTGSTDAPNAPTRTAKLEEKEGVFVVQAGKAFFRTVKTGIVGDTDIEITEGVKDGDQIVIGSYRTLRTLRNEAQLKIEDQTKKAAK
jgi:HlyD family secretion protein